MTWGCSGIMRCAIPSRHLPRWWRGTLIWFIPQRYVTSAIIIGRRKSLRRYLSSSRAKPGRWGSGTVLSGWLFQTTRPLHGKMTVADALRELDQYKLESDQRNHEILGPEGCAFQEGIGDGMRNDEAKRLLHIIQQNMGSNNLNQEQSDRLQSLLKAELCTLPLDDTDLFRTPEEWTQIVADRQQNVLTGADAFLTPAQLEMLRTVAAADLAQRREQMIVRRKSLGIK
jgi:hypothetical protein